MVAVGTEAAVVVVVMGVAAGMEVVVGMAEVVEAAATDHAHPGDSQMALCCCVESVLPLNRLVGPDASHLSIAIPNMQAYEGTLLQVVTHEPGLFLWVQLACF